MPPEPWERDESTRKKRSKTLGKASPGMPTPVTERPGHRSSAQNNRSRLLGMTVPSRPSPDRARKPRRTSQTPPCQSAAAASALRGKLCTTLWKQSVRKTSKGTGPTPAPLYCLCSAKFNTDGGPRTPQNEPAFGQPQVSELAWLTCWCLQFVGRVGDSRVCCHLFILGSQKLRSIRGVKYHEISECDCGLGWMKKSAGRSNCPIGEPISI